MANKKKKHAKKVPRVRTSSQSSVEIQVGTGSMFVVQCSAVMTDVFWKILKKKIYSLSKLVAYDYMAYMDLAVHCSRKAVKL